jgi:hypothetical protein
LSRGGGSNQNRIPGTQAGAVAEGVVRLVSPYQLAVATLHVYAELGRLVKIRAAHVGLVLEVRSRSDRTDVSRCSGMATAAAMCSTIENEKHSHSAN